MQRLSSAHCLGQCHKQLSRRGLAFGEMHSAGRSSVIADISALASPAIGAHGRTIMGTAMATPATTLRWDTESPTRQLRLHTRAGPILLLRARLFRSRSSTWCLTARAVRPKPRRFPGEMEASTRSESCVAERLARRRRPNRHPIRVPAPRARMMATLPDRARATRTVPLPADRPRRQHSRYARPHRPHS